MAPADLKQGRRAEAAQLDQLADILAGAFADAHAAKVAAAAADEARRVRQAKAAAEVLDRLGEFAAAYEAWHTEAKDGELNRELTAALAKLTRRARADIAA